MKCDIVVLTWNQLDVIKTFIESFLSNTTLPSRLIIVDNGSNDGTKEYLSSLKDTPDCAFKIILNKENKGYVGGMNQGLESSDAPYVCLANNDLIFTKGWLEEIISVFEKYENIGLLNPNSNNLGTRTPKGTSLPDFAADLKNRYKGLFVEMPFCIGFCMVVKREVIDKVGGMSEEFHPIFFEDSDYSMKVLKAGYLIGMAKASYVWHKEHAAFKQMSGWRETVFVRNRKIFSNKWGRILRIACVAGDYDSLKKNLAASVRLARNGNYIWNFTKDFKKDRAAMFKENGLNEHSGIKFVTFSNICDLLWKIIKKKKRYDLIVTQNNLFRKILRSFNYKCVNEIDDALIAEEKK